jgi:predicted RNA-binding protein with RPS1 domain
VRAVEDVVNVGDKLLVEVTEIDRQNRISLALVDEDAEGQAAASPSPDGAERQ